MNRLKSISLQKLEQMYKQEKDPKVKTKLLVVIHKKEKKKYKEISKSLKISESTIKRTISKFRKHGKEGLYRKPGSGNPGPLENKQKQQLIQYVNVNKPTSKDVNSYMKDNFGKSYHPFSVPRLLRSLGFSRITPRKQHYKTDKFKQEEWKDNFKKRQKSIWIKNTKSSSKMNQ